MPELKIYNTLTREKETFVPLDPERIRLYSCGPTVYNYIHIGNARMAVVFDVVQRVLEHLYPGKVTHAQNITDVDDKIIEAARKSGESIDAITQKFTAAYMADREALGCRPLTKQPKCREHIPGMVKMIEQLVQKGHAYEAEGNVLFSVPSMPDYGRLSRKNRDEQIYGARVEVAPYKKDPADFILWKPTKENEPKEVAFDSPWGKGRPGWHIECSVMAEATLGETFDIHGGGLDLIYPHHENEIAQSRCAHDAPIMAKYWMHNGFLDVKKEKQPSDGNILLKIIVAGAMRFVTYLPAGPLREKYFLKMSKSAGNFWFMKDIRDKYHGEVVRLALLSAHYRQPLAFGESILEQAKSTLDRIYRLLDETSSVRPIETEEYEEDLPGHTEALMNDFNTPAAIRRLFKDIEVMHQIYKKGGNASTLKALVEKQASLLGLLQQDPSAWQQWRPISVKVDVPLGKLRMDVFSAAISAGVITEEVISKKIAERKAARIEKDWKKSDRIRDELLKEGIALEDSPQGTTWRYVGK